MKLLSCVRLFATPWTAAYQALPSMGFSRQEYWSGVPSPSLMYSAAAAAVKLLQLCPTLCDPIDGRLPGPWDSPGKNTGVGCHFLLQCMKVKSESEAAQSCPTLSDPMDCSLSGSSAWDSPGKNTGLGCHSLLQCMKVKSENEVTQSCPTLSDPMDCSLPGSSVHGILQAKVLEWGAIASSYRNTNKNC